MGAVKTAGKGRVAPLGLPSAVAIVTVGRDAIVVDGELVVVVVFGVEDRVSSSRCAGWNFRLVCGSAGGGCEKP